jgi:hypothetical protein
MNRDPKTMTCHEFQDQLPELIGSGADVNSHPHLQSCELCRALLNDLQAIADAARGLFEDPLPSDDVWKGIETAIKEEESGLSKSE